jgi:hypothetical protein
MPYPPPPLAMNWTKNLNSNTSLGRIYEFFKVEFYYIEFDRVSSLIFKGGGRGSIIISGFQKGVGGREESTHQNVLSLPYFDKMF